MLVILEASARVNAAVQTTAAERAISRNREG
jgi:hypothetical protein